MKSHLNVNFFTEFIRKEVLTDLRLEDLKYWISRFGFYDLIRPVGKDSYGNLSFRAEPGKNEFVITATKEDFHDEKLTPTRFVKVVHCDINNNKVRVHGLENPSRDTFLHYLIYKNRPDINAVFHGHCDRLDCEPGLNFVTTEKEQPWGSVELAREVEKVLGKENFIIMRNHGFLALGKNIDDAGKTTLRAYQKCFQ
ncbi:MAG: class II aldolase/adducin family protein [Candidatus Aenigmarchaeota archaeon]|nr:class II aldolase/adducin family protein [Candidatus Aenigmarchaeota archaeon]